MITQSYRACNKGTIANLEVIADIQFNGGTVDVAILDADFTTRAGEERSRPRITAARASRWTTCPSRRSSTMATPS